MISATILATIAASAGKGFLAGMIGTAAMTVSSTAEAKLSGRGPSSTPADAAGTVLGVEPQDASGEQRFSTLAHWGYGTMWGGARGLIGAAGLRGPAAAAGHLAVVWGAEQIVLPATGVSPPVWRWGAKAVGTDLLHHGVYVAVTSLAYEWLDHADRSGAGCGISSGKRLFPR